MTDRDETFFDLSLDIEQNSSLTSCLKNFSSTETLNAEDKFFCDKCCRYVVLIPFVLANIGSVGYHLRHVFMLVLGSACFAFFFKKKNVLESAANYPIPLADLLG